MPCIPGPPGPPGPGPCAAEGPDMTDAGSGLRAFGARGCGGYGCFPDGGTDADG